MCLRTCAIGTDSDSSHACAKSPTGISFLLIQYMVFSDSVNGKRWPWSDCANAQADLGLRCPHLPDDTFSHGATQLFCRIEKYVICFCTCVHFLINEMHVNFTHKENKWQNISYIVFNPCHAEDAMSISAWQTILTVNIKSHAEWQTVPIQISWLLQANWSGSTLFAMTGYIRVQQEKG